MMPTDGTAAKASASSGAIESDVGLPTIVSRPPAASYKSRLDTFKKTTLRVNGNRDGLSGCIHDLTSRCRWYPIGVCHHEPGHGCHDDNAAKNKTANQYFTQKRTSLSKKTTKTRHKTRMQPKPIKLLKRRSIRQSRRTRLLPVCDT